MNPGPLHNERELLLQVAEGSEQAFKELFNAYRKKLYIYILKITGSSETAEDIVHDVFLKIWLNRKKLPQINNFNAYLYRMMFNQAYTGFQRMAKETLILAELQKEQGKGPLFEGEDRIIQKEVKQLIKEAVDKLTPQQKLVFIMSRQDGLRHEEIAQQLNISVYTVKNHIAYALRFLREEISRSYGSQAVAFYVFYGLSTW